MNIATIAQSASMVHMDSLIVVFQEPDDAMENAIRLIEEEKLTFKISIYGTAEYYWSIAFLQFESVIIFGHDF